MQPALAHRSASNLKLRVAQPADLDQLVALEHQAFANERMSRRSFGHFLASSTAALIVATHGPRVVGYALVLFRRGTDVARLYSIAVASDSSGRGVGSALLGAAEAAATARGCSRLRLEVHENNAAAIARYRKSGFRHFGHHHHYYADHGHALRFEKRLTPDLRGLETAPPYFHQTTEFTCGPACVIMALAWADPSLRPSAVLEFKLWREATTIFMGSGLGGCEPYGLAVASRHHGLHPTVHVSRRGSYFLDTVRSEEERRVMRLTQGEFRREADELGIATHLTRLGESALMTAFDSGATAIVLVAGYHMIRRKVPHWVFAFGHEGGYVLMHDPAAMRDDGGDATTAQTYAIPWPSFARAARFGHDDLSAAIVIRKGPLQ